MAIENLSNVTLTANNSIIGTTTNFLFEGILTRSVTAFLILIGGLLIGKLLERFVLRLFSALELNKPLSKIFRTHLPFHQIFANIISKAAYIITIILTLNQLRLTALVVDALSVLVITITVVIVLLSFKDFAKNFTAGIVLQARQIAKVGDVVYIDSVSGRVIFFDLLITSIKTTQGDIIHIPNGYIFEKKIKIVPKHK